MPSKDDKTVDYELEAMKKITEALAPLNGKARTRVVAWVNSRLDLELELILR